MENSKEPVRDSQLVEFRIAASKAEVHSNRYEAICDAFDRPPNSFKATPFLPRHEAVAVAFDQLEAKPVRRVRRTRTLRELFGL